MAHRALTATRTVLVADESPDACARVVSVLIGAGHLALRAARAAELTARVRENAQRFDLVVLDLRLAGGDPVGFVRALRQTPGFEARIVARREDVAADALVEQLSALGVHWWRRADGGDTSAIMHALAPYLYGEPANRREAVRAAVTVPISCTVGERVITGVTLNLGEGGVAVRTGTPMPPTTAMRVRFRLPQTTDDIEAEARVVWVDRLLGMGLEFTTMSAHCRGAVTGFLDSHAAPARLA